MSLEGTDTLSFREGRRVYDTENIDFDGFVYHNILIGRFLGA
jgi:hypothetical protein